VRRVGEWVGLLMDGGGWRVSERWVVRGEWRASGECCGATRADSRRRLAVGGRCLQQAQHE
jgi:hypothetical protein